MKGGEIQLLWWEHTHARPVWSSLTQMFMLALVLTHAVLAEG